MIHAFWVFANEPWTCWGEILVAIDHGSTRLGAGMDDFAIEKQGSKTDAGSCLEPERVTNRGHCALRRPRSLLSRDLGGARASWPLGLPSVNPRGGGPPPGRRRGRPGRHPGR